MLRQGIAPQAHASEEDGQKNDGIEPDSILIKLASCITKENSHGPACPHLDYLKTLVQKAGLSYSCDTHLSQKAEAKRASGVYKGTARS
jgi:hypothetical protein